MSKRTSFDVLIIGAGQAGIPLAHALAKAGKWVALAEREHLGGSCVNFGCTPTKAVISSAHMVHQARRAAEFGQRIPTVEVDFSSSARTCQARPNGVSGWSNVKGIWVAGDIRGGPMFTHTSWDDYRVLMSQLTGDGSHTTDRVVPNAIFTDPELGRVGTTEREARKSGKRIKVSYYEMKKNGKAREQGDTEGFIKVVVDADTKWILGAAVLAVEGAELVHMYVDLMNAGAPQTVIKDAVHIHPTMAEALQSVLLEID